MHFARQPLNGSSSRPALRFALFVLFALQAVTAVAQVTGNHGEALSRTAELAREKLYLEAATIQDLDVPTEAWADVHTAVRLGEKEYTLSLYPHSVRSWEFKLLVQDESGKLLDTPPPPPTTFSGTVLGVPNSEVAASVIDGRLTAIILLDGSEGAGEQWFVQPLSDVDPAAFREAHVVFNGTDVVGEGWTCGTDDLPLHAHDDDCGCEPNGVSGGGQSIAGTGNMIADIAFDTDVEFYNKNGFSVTNTLADIEKVVNGMRVVYERDVDITFEITTVIVRTTEPDPYSTKDAGALLNAFGNYWNANLKGIKRDMAHLMTGKNLFGGTIGVAWPSVVCNKSSAYALSESRFSNNINQRVTLTSHEVGHNWSAPHCDGKGNCHIMCSVLGGCGGIGMPNFGPDSIAKISGFRDSRTCLWDEEDPIQLPFFEDFPLLDLNRANWSYKNGAAISADGIAEPSAPYAMNIDASGSGLYEEDELRSNVILLAGSSNIELAYHTQHRGVENGEQLVVEFRTSSSTWQVLNTITSDGVDQNTFVFHSHILPSNAYHDGFRVRFSAVVDEANDDWYLDDVSVGDPQQDPPMLTDVTPKAGIEAGGTDITVTGDHFTTNPAMTVSIGGVDCTNVSVISANKLTCMTGAGTMGFQDLVVSNLHGSDTLSQAFRYFPVNVDAFNATDIETSSLNTPVDFSLIASGYPSNAFVVFLSFTGGPVNTPYGTMGLGFPILFLFQGILNGDGYFMLPASVGSGLGPVDFYIHILGLDGTGNPIWSSGGNNPNGSGSVLIHLNN